MRLIPRLLVVILPVLLACAEERPLQPVEPFSLGLHERWGNVEAEEMAAWMSKELTAPRELYERIDSDLTQIRERWSETFPVVTTTFLAPISLSWVGAIVDFEARDDILAGTHSEFDSLNALYGALDLNLTPYFDQSLAIRFEAVLNPCEMFLSYAKLRGFRSVHGNGVVDCRCRYIFPLQTGDTMHYFFQEGFAINMPCKCPGYRYRYFRTAPDGVEYVGYHAVLNGLEDSTPAWRGLLTDAITSHYNCRDDSYRFVDKTPPARILNLKLIGRQEGDSARIWFTTPGDDGMEGNALELIVLIAREPITDSNWGRVVYKTAKFATGPPGRDTLLTIAVDPQDTNYIAIRSHDGSGNWSRISNNVTSTNAWLKGWTYFTPENSSLPSYNIYKMLRDSRDRLWIATGAGVVCIDEVQWTVYTAADGSLPDGIVTGIAEGPGGVMWFGTKKGLARFDGQNWQTYTLEDVGLPRQDVACLGVSQTGDVWFGYGYFGSGLVRFDGDNWTRYSPANAPMQGYSVHAILGDSHGSVWFATQLGLHRITGDTWESFSPQIDGIGDSRILSLYEDPEGIIFCGGQNGTVSEFDGTGWHYWSSSGPGVNSLNKGDDGIVWGTTSLGFWREEPPNVRRFTATTTGLSWDGCTGIAFDEGRGIWISTGGNGLCYWDLKAAKLDSSSDITQLDN